MKNITCTSTPSAGQKLTAAKLFGECFDQWHRNFLTNTLVAEYILIFPLYTKWAVHQHLAVILGAQSVHIPRCQLLSLFLLCYLFLNDTHLVTGIKVSLSYLLLLSSPVTATFSALFPSPMHLISELGCLNAVSLTFLFAFL